MDSIRFNEHRYSVKLPWKVGCDLLPSNYITSLLRLKGQVKKLRREPKLLGEYDAIIKDQVSSGVIESVTQLESAEKVHYLPHLAVIRKDASTTKMRIVYDASSREGKGNSNSLNDCLRVGPSLNPLLFDILVRFREHNIVLIADIEKAFLNIEVEKEDRDCLRFLWLADIRDPNSEILVYRFCRVVFGLNASPFLLNATLRYHFSKYTHDAELMNKMIESFDVDDLVSGARRVSEAFHLYTKSKGRLAEGGFKLRKWKTNNKQLRDQISEDMNDRMQGKPIFDDKNESYAKQTLGPEVHPMYEKVLGLSWDCENDKIQFNFQKTIRAESNSEPTKRNILAQLAGFFDPLGLISPVLACIKTLFQILCVAKVGWDDPLQDKTNRAWEEWIKELC